jgi:Raf kinase inhibitor-like YbhB/YbcL family protein
MKRFGLFCLLFFFLFAIAYADDGGNPSQKEDDKMPIEKKAGTLELKSDSFNAGESIPEKHTCDGLNISPQLSWSGVPGSTKELVVIVDDPDAPAGDWVHWVLYGLPPDTTYLAENFSKTDTAAGARQGKNDFGKIGYGGPCPPRGSTHRYFFKLYAINHALDLKPGATKAEIEKAIAGHILAQGELMGKYKRK